MHSETSNSAYDGEPEEKLTYVVVTPAWNEAEFIERTLKSMITQTVPPLAWVIVSDGSTDETDTIVAGYAAKYSWIGLLRMPERKERHFAGKVHAFNAGYAAVKGLDFDVVGNIDADISFTEDHLEYLLGKFSENRALGMAGTAYVEDSSQVYDYDVVNIEDISGACQLFRRRCFEEIGGYIPIKGGGIDSAAVYTARMKGWETRTFPEKAFFHHRKRWTGQGTLLAGFFKSGKRDYNLGGHLVWELFRSVYQMKRKPFVIGGLLLLSGYLSLFLTGAERPVSRELVAFRRKEQMQRLRSLLRNAVVRKRVSHA